MVRTIKLMVFTLIFSGLISCTKNDTPAPSDPKITFNATLTGASEVPANGSTATGSSSLLYNDDSNTFTITTTYSGLSGPVTAAHIHKGAVGVAGGPIFTFTSFASPIIYTSAALDATQEADLKAGLYYVNVHTAMYAGGEIRGQLIRQ